MLKTCSKCLTIKPIESFYKRKGSPDGLHHQCSSCICAKNKRWCLRVGYDTNAKRYLTQEEIREREDRRQKPREKKTQRKKYPRTEAQKEQNRAYNRSEKAKRRRRERYAERKAEKTLRKRSLNSRIKNVLKSRLRGKMGNVTKLEALLGATIEQTKFHLESLFQPGMSWENYGTWRFGQPMKWHIDHIKPCAAFDLTKEEEQRKCFHYTNLQPLWAIDNIKKADKIVDKTLYFV